MAGPLAGLRVLDLSRILAGPWATQNFADMGADVIKIERPGEGDDTRKMGPPWIRDAATGESVDAAYFASCNRGKRSVTLDIASPDGRAIAHRLVAASDVLVENYKVGALARYGLDYASVATVNPRIVYCSITGFGQTGPYAQRPGYDFLIQGMGGLMSVTGERDDLPGGGPQRAGVALADILTGMYATTAVVAALLHREHSGRGQYIDMALLDAQVATLANQGMNWLIGGTVPTRFGNGHPNIVPYQAFATTDGHVILAVGNDEQFARFCAAAGRPDLASDARYQTIAQRNANRATLIPELAAILAARSTDEWVALAERVQVPIGPINTIDRVFADPQVVARGMRVDLPHPRAGTLPSIASPMRFSETPIEYTHAPPVLGQHTAEVLRELCGVDDAELARLRDAHVV
ncbi:MAG TPA: CaiB/BaiF CoA-transferase family protein [Casimicrobiaceae bacterium]|nr:CaiB/BaiF CoA-transferase family protein [Casimicrobiaceae bacterium]